jgi:uncharacterized protein (TIGR00730 family)
LALDDANFLLRDEMRPTRLALEFAKADLLLRDWGVRSTVIVFGSARALSPEAGEIVLAADQRNESIRARVERSVRRYEAARSFGRIVSERGGAMAPHGQWRDNVIATGGGPGIMEAANRGAHEAGAPTIGFNITLPREQKPNSYLTPELTFRFHYFAMRKMHFALRASALAIFPGGFGTLDELFELLTLRQTNKSQPLPIVLFDRTYWQSIVNFEALIEEEMIRRDDLNLFEYADTAEEAWHSISKHGLPLRGTPLG